MKPPLPYEKPILRRVRLQAGELLAGSCKEGNPSNLGGSAKFGSLTACTFVTTTFSATVVCSNIAPS